MNILSTLLLITLFVDIFSPCCLARRKRPAYLTPAPEGVYRHKKPLLVSPFVKQITQKNKTLVKQLQKLEFQGQQEISRSEKQARKLQKELSVQQAKLEKEKDLQISQLQQQNQNIIKHIQAQLNKKLYDAITQLSKRTEHQLTQLKKETQKKEESLVTQTKKETLRKINQAEMRLIENYLGAKHKTDTSHPEKILAQRNAIPEATPVPAPVDTNAQMLADWKKTKQQELEAVITLLEPILSSDEELTQLLANKKMSIATNITDTQKIEDESYNAVMTDLKPLLLVYEAQKAADQLVDETLQTLAIAPENRQAIRFIILAELQPHMKEAIDAGQAIAPEQIQTLVTQAVAEVQQKQMPITPLPTPIPQPQQVVDETLREQLAMLEEKLREIQETSSQHAQQTDATINELKQNLEQLKKEKLSLQILAQQTQEKLAQTEQFQEEFSSMKNSLEAQSKEQLKLEILLEQNKNELLQANLSEQKKQNQIEKLERTLQESKQNITMAQGEVTKIRSLQEQLKTMQTSYDKRFAKLTNKQQEAEKTHQIKQAILSKQQAQLHQENIDLKKRVIENTQLKKKITHLTTQVATARDDVQKAQIKQKIEQTKQLMTQKKLDAQMKKEELRKKTAQFADLSSNIHKIANQAKNQIVNAHKQRLRTEIASRRLL